MSELIDGVSTNVAHTPCIVVAYTVHTCKLRTRRNICANMRSEAQFMHEMSRDNRQLRCEIGVDRARAGIVARSSGRAERFLGQQGIGSVCDVELMRIRFSLQSIGLDLLQDRALFIIPVFFCCRLF